METKYKTHPKLAEIQEEKKRLKEMLMKARVIEQQELNVLKKDRELYMKNNKEEIENKQKVIYEMKKVKRDKIREEDLGRGERVSKKKSEILMKLIPERREAIEKLRGEYIAANNETDEKRKKRLQSFLHDKLEAENKQLQIQLNWSKVKEKVIENEKIIDTNEGDCVLCLSEEACIYMQECKHLICCENCSFMIRMNRKCPLCRVKSNFINLKEKKTK